MEIDIRIFMGINRRRSLGSALAEQGDAEYIKELMEGIFDIEIRSGSKFIQTLFWETKSC